MTRAFVFPGQGSQAVGMGKSIFESSAKAREVFGEVDEALKQNLSKLMFEGPIEELTQTENAQPALLAVSMALLSAMEKEANIKLTNAAKFVAGHSLGEYSALCANRTFSLTEAAKLLKLRGQAMQKAVPNGIGAMAALLGMNLEQAQEVAKLASNGKGEICVAANDNSPEQVVISGHKVAVERALPIAKERGAKRGLLLPVTVPSHSPLMAPAADTMQQALVNTRFGMPSLPLVANVTAKAEQDPNNLRKLLVEQMTNMVRWRESIQFLKSQGVTQIVEIGSGKVLTGLVKRIDPEIQLVNIEGPADIETFLKGM
ncbi:MAG: [acyl-carrier-protein] S-malonyltransferase [Alphaproteobacteria bacterium]|nr:MAG: [acyl-carrier-protein] S-malonyltransferase [Alphaproteobacteria bacterium]